MKNHGNQVKLLVQSLLDLLLLFVYVVFPKIHQDIKLKIVSLTYEVM